jgi:hypothetical protein
MLTYPRSSTVRRLAWPGVSNKQPILPCDCDDISVRNGLLAATIKFNTDLMSENQIVIRIDEINRGF